MLNVCVCVCGRVCVWAWSDLQNGVASVEFFQLELLFAEIQLCLEVCVALAVPDPG